MKKLAAIALAIIFVLSSLCGCGPCESSSSDEPLAMKPVIYLYPEEPQTVRVALECDGRLTCTYPASDGIWEVTAEPDGRLFTSDGREYSYLYWEGALNAHYDMTRGFVVKGADTAEFLREALEKLGLTPREYNEFIVFWLPQLQDNPYNLISFQTDAYADAARLTVSPQPDSLLRVFMSYTPLEKPVEVPPQTLEPFERTGFTVVEWGGAKVG